MADNVIEWELNDLPQKKTNLDSLLEKFEEVEEQKEIVIELPTFKLSSTITLNFKVTIKFDEENNSQIEEETILQYQGSLKGYRKMLGEDKLRVNALLNKWMREESSFTKYRTEVAIKPIQEKIFVEIIIPRILQNVDYPYFKTKVRKAVFLMRKTVKSNA